MATKIPVVNALVVGGGGSGGGDGGSGHAVEHSSIQDAFRVQPVRLLHGSPMGKPSQELITTSLQLVAVSWAWPFGRHCHVTTP